MSGEFNFEGQRAVHIGPGNFALSHIVPFFSKIGLEVHGISLRTDTTKKLLQDTDFNYTLVSRDSVEFFEAEPISVLTGITNVPLKESNAPQCIIDQQRSVAVAYLGDPKTRIVTMTVTIDGYGYEKDPSKRTIDPKTGSIVSVKPDQLEASRITDPCVEKDAETTIATLVAGLNERCQNGAGPLVVMSLDNMPLNGTHLYRAVKRFALQHYGPELQDWIKNNTFFPDTMVDRIAPLRDEAMIDSFVAESGVVNDRSNVVVVTEKLPERALVISTTTQASIELGRPVNPIFDEHPILKALTTLPGVEQSAMANLYSERKVHIFNGAHFGLALVGRLAGYTYAHEAIADPSIRAFIEDLLHELSAGVNPEISGDNAQYRQEFIDRVSNPHMKDKLERIGRNGSVKLFERVLIPWHIAVTKRPDAVSHKAIDTVGAAWVRYLAKAAEAKREGFEFNIEDKNALRLKLDEFNPETYEDAQLIIGVPEVLDNTPGREEFGNDINSAFSHLDFVLGNSRRGARVVDVRGFDREFSRPFDPQEKSST